MYIWPYPRKSGPFLSRELRKGPPQSGHLAPCPGHPSPSPGNPEHANQRVEESGNSSPDIRLFMSHRTSSPQPGHPGPACAQRSGQGPMYPRSHLPLRGLTLYIDPHLLLVRVSKGLAHLEIELCSSISDLLHERDRGPSIEKTPMDSIPPLG